jgi:hypothetical protein
MFHKKTKQSGIAWVKANSLEEPRHSCKHEHKLQRWGWQAYDGRHYGLEVIGDKAQGVVSY